MLSIRRTSQRNSKLSARRRRFKGRDITGVLLLDKPVGSTSNAALQEVKQLYGAAKAGHTGSLDPLATGMLPICFGEATKFAQFMLDADKHYVCRAKLGVRTATGDSDGEVLSEHDVPSVSQEGLESLLDRLRGPIEQIPPMYSAIKHEGQPLYKLARQGIEVERKPRQVVVKRLELIERAENEIQLVIECTKGTYVRTLIEDLGGMLGCGAHVTALRRSSVAGIADSRMVTLEQLQIIRNDDEPSSDVYHKLDELLLPTLITLQGLPEVVLTDHLAYYLGQGQPVFVPNTKVQGKVVLMHEQAGQQHKFIGIGEVLDDGRVAPRRLMTR